jgi:predicted lipid-binding transport protein (Tim44 family)
MKLLAAFIVVALIGTPALSFARTRCEPNGDYSRASWNGAILGDIESRKSGRYDQYDQYGAPPIQQSTTPQHPPIAQTAPAKQPIFSQRSPLFAGLASGVAGSWIGLILFGVTDSSAQATDADAPADVTSTTDETSSSAGILLLLLLLAAGAIFYFLKVQRRSLPDFSGIAGRGQSDDSLPTRRFPSTRQKMSVDRITTADKAAFQQLLLDVQRAWSKQDLTELRQFVTLEMLNYFSAALADNTSQDIQNHVDDVVLLRAEVLEAWTEQAVQYVTAGLRWSARDYNLSLTKQRGESGYVTEGDDETPTESGEAWTFMRSPDGKWLLSAIQQ